MKLFREPSGDDENASQLHSHPAIEFHEGRFPAVFEVFKSATQRAVHCRDDRSQDVTMVASSLPSYRILELLQALLPGKPAMLDEAVTKEFQAFIVDMDEFSLGGMQS